MTEMWYVFLDQCKEMLKIKQSKALHNIYTDEKSWIHMYDPKVQRSRLYVCGFQGESNSIKVVKSKQHFEANGHLFFSDKWASAGQHTVMHILVFI